jgi:hypothetical protein
VSKPTPRLYIPKPMEIWRLVAWTGYHLLEQVTAVDPLVVLLFGLFHDSQRKTEYDDPDHGRRAGKLSPAGDGELAVGLVHLIDHLPDLWALSLVSEKSTPQVVPSS